MSQHGKSMKSTVLLSLVGKGGEAYMNTCSTYNTFFHGYLIEMFPRDHLLCAGGGGGGGFINISSKPCIHVITDVKAKWIYKIGCLCAWWKDLSAWWM